MKAEYPLHKKAWLYGLWTGFTPTVFLRLTQFKPIKYPHSFKDDLSAIGVDMWHALGKEDERRKFLKPG